MTLDYGSTGTTFCQNTIRLHNYISKWNSSFFAAYNLQIDLLVLQTPFDYKHNQQTISVLENNDKGKFEKFMSDLHRDVNFQK